MIQQPIRRRSFLLLQGPAGHFFSELARALSEAGCVVHRVNFCGGDRVFSPAGASDYRGPHEEWPSHCTALMDRLGTTDLVLYGDCRPLHAEAIALAQGRGSKVWVFEEGYLRPHFVTLERGGANGYSTLPHDTAGVFARAAELRASPTPEPPHHNGGTLRHLLRHHAIYHAANLAARPWFRHWRTHRPYSAGQELARGWVRRVPRLLLGGRGLGRRAVEEVCASRLPFFLFPLQLDTDYQVRVHSPFASITDAIACVVPSFARGAPPESLLVVKCHPLDNGMIDLQGAVMRAAREHGVERRIRYIDGGHLPTLLSHCRGVVTVNSTAGFSALIHRRPVKALGRAIYDLPGLCFQGDLDEFWTLGSAPDAALLQAFRSLVIAETQVRGDFYSGGGVRQAVSGALLRLGMLPVHSRPSVAAATAGTPAGRAREGSALAA
jgi:capsular polysaccharide export protein